ncbi:MAG: hypothetical protein J6X02_04545 [Bacilli bacterium]|nr:hypothetical protein [Bacilli bacterium]
MINIKISPEELREHSKKIVDRSANINAKIDAIEESMRTLDAWKSENKELFFNELRAKIKDLRAMAEASTSYGAVGQDVANRVIGVESSIRETLLKNQEPA